MKNQYILTLLNIKGIGLSAVNYLIKNDPSISFNCDKIINKFIVCNKSNKRIKVPCENDVKEAINTAKHVLEISYENNINCINSLDDGFPEKLKNINNPPVLLFYKGDKNIIFNDESVAIIGTRKPTSHGKKIAERLGFIFGQERCIVVSGLAKGCDENAHKGCVNARGKSIAVLPSSLDKVYPASNNSLAESILEEGGCLISEYQIGHKLHKNNMVERDRLQSALSRAVIVIETTLDGGTMHTVEFALSQNRQVVVYKHDDKFVNEEQVQGNLKLLENPNVIKLSTGEDIDKIKQLIMSDKPLSNSSENEQINIFDKF